jgi:hypothetical protein
MSVGRNGNRISMTDISFDILYTPMLGSLRAIGSGDRFLLHHWIYLRTVDISLT